MFSKPKPTTVSGNQTVSPHLNGGAQATKEGSDIESFARRMALIGPTTCINGDIAGEENLTIEGQVKGIIEFKNNTVTIGSNGNVQGDVFAHTLHVSGQVEGRLIVLNKVTVHEGARVLGSIISPCLVLEDGSTFQGSVDMNPDHELLAEAFGALSATSSESGPATFNVTGISSQEAPVTEDDVDHDPSSADHNRWS